MVTEFSRKNGLIIGHRRISNRPLNVTLDYLRRSNLPFERFRNARLYIREDVDSLRRKRERGRHPQIEEWYTVDEIMIEYEITRKQYSLAKRQNSLYLIATILRIESSAALRVCSSI